MPQTLAAVKRVIWLQRSGACAIWLLIVVKLAAVLWLEMKPDPWMGLNMIKAAFSPTHWMYAVALLLLQGPVAVAHSAVLFPLETEPLQLPNDLAQLKRAMFKVSIRITPTSWLRGRQGASSNNLLLIELWNRHHSANAQHALGRILGSWRQTGKMVALLVTATLSAVITVHMFGYLKASSAGATTP